MLIDLNQQWREQREQRDKQRAPASWTPPDTPAFQPRPDDAEKLKRAVEGMRGLGDVVAKVAEVTGAKAVVEYMNGGKPCGGCAKRQEKLNRAVPFKSE